MTPLSRGHVRDVFSGKETTLTPFLLNSGEWPGVLSNIKRNLRGSPFLARYFLISGTKHLMEPVQKNGVSSRPPCCTTSQGWGRAALQIRGGLLKTHLRLHRPALGPPLPPQILVLVSLAHECP